MKGDSEIIDITDEESGKIDSDGVELIYVTKCSRLYRQRKDGKYFLLKRSAIAGERGKKILRREYELSIGCDHPNIVDVYEYRRTAGEGDELVMEYVEGRTLSEFLAENPSNKTKKRIFYELLDAVGYLHQRRIIHNDLKPENILISRNGNHVKIIDLGLSDDDAHYEMKTPGYSVVYAAPELSQQRKSDIRSDIYSLGVIMRNLFGKRYSAVSKKCMRKEPEKRFNNINAFKRKWKRNQNIIRELIIVFLIIMVLSAFSVLFFVNINQKEGLEKIQKKLSTQFYELNEQRQQYQTLQETYQNLKDSINIEDSRKRAHEEKKTKVINEFKTELLKAKNITLDSIRRGYPKVKEQYIRNNYLNYVKKLYDRQPREIDGEDVKALMFSIYQQSFVAAFDEFNEAIRVLEE